jgi:hypothetical protein
MLVEEVVLEMKVVVSLENKSGYQGRQLGIYISRLCLRITIVPAISNGRLMKPKDSPLSSLCPVCQPKCTSQTSTLH